MKEELATRTTFPVSYDLQTSWECAGDGDLAAVSALEKPPCPPRTLGNRPTQGWPQSTGYVQLALRVGSSTLPRPPQYSPAHWASVLWGLLQARVPERDLPGASHSLALGKGCAPAHVIPLTGKFTISALWVPEGETAGQLSAIMAWAAQGSEHRDNELPMPWPRGWVCQAVPHGDLRVSLPLVPRMVLLLTHLLQAAPTGQCRPAAIRTRGNVPDFSHLGPGHTCPNVALSQSNDGGMTNTCAPIHGRVVSGRCRGQRNRVQVQDHQDIGQWSSTGGDAVLWRHLAMPAFLVVIITGCSWHPVGRGQGGC